MKSEKHFKVSVIIPVYNAEEFLSECLDSVLFQTLQHVEIICINDGSTDRSLEILQTYAGTYERIILLDQLNQGVGAARNNGIDIARGEYIAFMDPDDFYPDEEVLECLYRNATNHNVLICGGSFSRDRDGVVIDKFDGINKGYTFEDDGRQHFFDYQFPFGFTRYIYQTKLLTDNLIRFPLYGRCQDLPFLMKAMLAANEFYAIKKVVYRYRLGHQKVILNPKKTIDLASGYLDILLLSKKYKLQKYHSIILDAMHVELKPALYTHLSNGYAEMHEIIQRINESIDSNLLTSGKHAFESPYLLASSTEINEQMEQINTEEDKFSVLLKFAEQIIVYGAGRFGNEVVEYIQHHGDFKIMCVAVSDTTGNVSDVLGVPVKGISELLQYTDTAQVFIAVATTSQPEIEVILKNLGFKNITSIDLQTFELFEANRIKRFASL